MAAGTRHGIDIRGALPRDASDIALLLGLLGYPVATTEAAARLERVQRDQQGTVLVATGADGGVIGVIAVHWCDMLQQPRAVGRITTLVVDDREARRGVGRLLVRAGAQAARGAGCEVLELTTGNQRDGAQAFYRSIGFVQDAQRFSRSLRKKPVES